MLVERNVQVMNVEVVGEAYDIAAYYLKKTGVIEDVPVIHDRLLRTSADCAMMHHRKMERSHGRTWF